jgi:hypothetical protein
MRAAIVNDIKVVADAANHADHPEPHNPARNAIPIAF